ncbi:MAG TPA: 2-dehydropantoate 2-reductase N-terminal domain-containing protein, partial [Hyphomicrobium sp.]
MALQSVGIVGGGAWGTALAVSARRAGRDVTLWAYEPETIAEINQQHRNALYLPGVALDPAIKATAKLDDVAACDLVLMVTPAQELRAIAGELVPYMREEQPLVIGAKGIEQSTGQLLSQVVAEVLPQVRTAVLSGPSFAAEIARGLPAALTLATASEAHGRALAHALSHASFRCYWSDDVA